VKGEFLSADEEPALRGDRLGPVPLDPSEEKVARKEALRREKPAAEIDRIRDLASSEPALVGSEGAGDETFRRWLDDRRSRVGVSKGLLVALIAGIIAGPFAIVGALSKGPGVSVGVVFYAIMFAPVIEEFLKQSGMIFILERRPYLAKSAWQFPLAAVVAAVIFATVENLMYLHIYTAEFSDEKREALARFRWPVCTALHVSCAFIASFGLVRVWRKQNEDGKPAQLSYAYPLFGSAIVIHALYNFAATFFIHVGE
jgi:hypothetical protein